MHQKGYAQSNIDPIASSRIRQTLIPMLRFDPIQCSLLQTAPWTLPQEGQSWQSKRVQPLIRRKMMASGAMPLPCQSTATEQNSKTPQLPTDEQGSKERWDWPVHADMPCLGQPIEACHRILRRRAPEFPMAHRPCLEHYAKSMGCGR